MVWTAEDKLKCVERELELRRHVYRRFVARGTMTQTQADREIAIMAAIVDDYRAKAATERLI